MFMCVYICTHIHIYFYTTWLDPREKICHLCPKQPNEVKLSPAWEPNYRSVCLMETYFYLKTSGRWILQVARNGNITSFTLEKALL